MAKKRRIVPKIRRDSNNNIYKDTVRQMKEVNRRIRQLERGIDLNKGAYNLRTKKYERKGVYTITNENGVKVKVKPTNIVNYRSDSWAGKKLKEKLSTLDNFNIKDIKKLKIPKNMSSAEMKVLNKAFSNFLNSQTSTIQGIKKVEERTKEGLRDLVSDIENINNKDIETLYTFFSDKDYTYITKVTDIDPSDLNVLLAKTKSEGGTSDDFLRKIENYIDKDSIYQDDDLVDSLESIYNKFNK